MNARIAIRAVLLAVAVVAVAILVGFVLAVVVGMMIAHPTGILIGLGVILFAGLVASIVLEATDTTRYGDPYG